MTSTHVQFGQLSDTPQVGVSGNNVTTIALPVAVSATLPAHLLLATNFGGANVRLDVWKPTGWRTYNLNDLGNTIPVPFRLDLEPGDQMVSLARETGDSGAVGWTVVSTLA